MPVTLNELREQLRTATEAMHRAATAVEEAEEGADLEALQTEADEAIAEVERVRGLVESRERIERARTAHPMPDQPAERSEVRVTSDEPVYRRDGRHSFFQDLFRSGRGDSGAAERIARHRLQVGDVEQRDISTGSGSGAGVVPPVYLAELLVDKPREGRQIAGIFPTLPLPDMGMTISVPRITANATVAAQSSENSAVSETDETSDQLDIPVRTYAGMQDFSVQAMERSDPAFDMLIATELAAAYDDALDTALITGSGSSGEHTGIHSVSSVNTVTYTDSDPSPAELLPKVYGAISQVRTNRKRPPTHIVMHPRRAAWLASGLSSTFPLVQQGALVQAAGQQNGGFVFMFAGLPVVVDANIGTTYGTGTNEDEIYVVHAPSSPLMEGPLRVDAYPQPLADKLAVRTVAFAYSAFASTRYPKSIAIISGTGLAAPSGF
jgi:HK97 family phage major capsid protein